jgi:hypothetical protein
MVAVTPGGFTFSASSFGSTPVWSPVCLNPQSFALSRL